MSEGNLNNIRQVYLEKYKFLLLFKDKKVIVKTVEDKEFEFKLIGKTTNDTDFINSFNI